MTGAAGNEINLRQPLSWNVVSSQKTDPASLLSWHRALITLRSARSSLRQGSYSLVANTGGVFAYERNLDGERTLVVMNTGAEAGNLTVTLSSAPSAVHTLFGSDNVSWTSGSSTITLNNVAGFGVRVLALEAGTAGANLINDIPYQTPPAPAYYLMGTLSDWSSGAAMAPLSGVSDILSVSRPLNANTPYFFKFKTGSSWYGWNELGSKYDTSLAASLSGTAVYVNQFQDDGSADHNIQFTPQSSGTYRYLYRYTDQRWCVVQD
ncbi:MAG: alpha-glucosidase C-terminal domain-containing protein [Treponema sp.]|nr:alpha-glucosidase C-terminal domain-containing protein [Treponema sp.]